VLDSGGGNNHFAAMVVGEVIRSGRFDELVAQGHARYAARRRAMAEALRGGPYRFDEPSGGFFVWLALADGVDPTTAAETAQQHGVLVSDGRNFFETPPATGYLRLSFSMLEEPLLVEGARRLESAINTLR
jgi:DNA-binding transcriptional MocR family regulator